MYFILHNILYKNKTIKKRTINTQKLYFFISQTLPEVNRKIW